MDKIKHIGTILWNQRKHNAWLWAELFLVSICIWYVVDFIGPVWRVTRIPTGFDISHTYRVTLGNKTPGSDGYIDLSDNMEATGKSLLTLVERIRQNPMIEAVSVSVSSQPYLSLMNGHRDILYYQDTIGIPAQRYWATPAFFDVFKIHGPDITTKELKDKLTPNSILISPEAASRLMPDENLLGKYLKINMDGHPRQVGGITTPIRPTEYQRPWPGFYILMSEQDILTQVNPENLHVMELCIRVKPEMDKNFRELFFSEHSYQLHFDNIFVIDVISTSAYRERTIGYEKGLVVVRGIMFVFLLINIFFGISGTFWLRTRQRRGEIGLRIAVGSSKANVRNFLFIEGLILLVIAFLPAALVGMNIMVAELVEKYWMDVSWIRYVIGIAITFLILVITVMSGIWYPAYYTMKMHPAEALKHE